MFNTKLKSVASEKLVEVDLLLKGYEPFSPTAYGGDQDLLVMVNGNPYKIQVKSGTVEDNKIRVDIRKSSNAKERHYNADAYDVLAVVHVEFRRVAYIKRSSMTAKSSINMWLDSNITSKGAHPDYVHLLFDDFLEFPIR